MKRNKFIIIGLGNLGLELLKKLSKDIEIVCIDLDPDNAEKAKEVREDITVITGDSTSRLVLEDAGAAEADGVIITSSTEKVAIESARLLRESFDARRVIVMATTKEGLEALEALGVEVINIFSASATEIRNKLEQKSRAAHAIGLGKDEILEVEVHPNSRLANRALRKLTPIRWRIGLIYRDENIIVPRNDTVLKPKDRVIILGDPPVLKTVAEIFTFKFQQFPLEYGSTAVVYCSGSEQEVFFQEVDYLLSILSLNRAVFILSPGASEKEDYFNQHIRKDRVKHVEIKKTAMRGLQAIEKVVAEIKGDHGLLILDRSMIFASIRPFVYTRRRKALIENLLKVTVCPMLIAGGTFPYEKAAVPCIEEINIQHSLETALEIASALSNEVSALLARPSKYISDDEDAAAFEEMKKTVNDISLMYKIGVKKDILDGNPVKSMSESLRNHNLVIADVGRWKTRGWLSQLVDPDVVWHILKNTAVSTLLLPHVEESL